MLPSKTNFIRAFNGIARHKHRYSVFSDFVTISAISIHNAIHKNDTLENEYLEIVKRYSKEDVTAFCHLLGELVLLLEPEPKDVLGGLYMELEISEKNTGQFFTPPEISLMMAQMLYSDALKTLDNDFVTLSEPACGAGGMVLAFAKMLVTNKYNPARTLWVQCIDVDRVAALMCYLQLSLWHIPAQVIVGNTLTMKFNEVWHTPAHYLECWDSKLKRRETTNPVKKTAKQSQILKPPLSTNFNVNKIVQFDFEF